MNDFSGIRCLVLKHWSLYFDLIYFNFKLFISPNICSYSLKVIYIDLKNLILFLLKYNCYGSCYCLILYYCLFLFKMIHYYEKLLLLLIHRETSSNATHDYCKIFQVQYFLNLFTVKLKYFSNFWNLSFTVLI